jgi:DivIVA domain-containing protein
MPLTPEGVRTWKFGTTRFRRGYDRQEVDAFLELVEEELIDRDIQTEQVRVARWFDSSPGLPEERSRQTGTGLPAAGGTMAAAAFHLQMAAESSARTIADQPSRDKPPGQPRTAWHHQPAFMLTFGVVAILLTITSVGYRLTQEPRIGPGRAAVTADSHASPVHIAGELAGGPDAERAAAGSDMSAPAPAPAPVRPPDPGVRLGRPHSIAPVNAVTFGPHGPGQGDNPHGAWLAIDGQRRTAWHTRRYTTARFGSLDPGTGLLLDMGNTVTITAVRVTLGAATGASFQIRIGNQPMLADLRPAASSAGPGGVVRMTLGRPVRGRYVAVWFTRLPPGPAGTYQAAVCGIGVKAWV